MSSCLLTHIGLSVRNLERSADFYHQYANLKIISQRQENSMRVAWLGNPDVSTSFIIVLLETDYEAPGKGSYHHLGFQVSSRERVDEIARHARELGILEAEAKDHGPVAGYLCVIRDPDGNGVEFSYGQEVLEVLGS